MTGVIWVAADSMRVPYPFRNVQGVKRYALTIERDDDGTLIETFTPELER